MKIKNMLYILFFVSFLVSTNMIFLNYNTESSTVNNTNQESADLVTENQLAPGIDTSQESEEYSSDIGELVYQTSDLNTLQPPEEIIKSQLLSLSSYEATFNLSNNDFVHSGDWVRVTISTNISFIHYSIEENSNPFIEQNITNSDLFFIEIPDLNTSSSKRDIRILIKLYENVSYFPNNFVSYSVLDLTVDNELIFITGGSHLQSLKVAPNSVINFTFNPTPVGYNWRFDGDNYSPVPTIKSPLTHGDHLLSLILVNDNFEEQFDPETGLPYQFHFYVDTEAPVLNPMINFSETLRIGTTLDFENVTETLHPINNPFADLTTFYFNFTSLNISYVNEFPLVPDVSVGSYVLQASVQDSVGNYNNETYIVKIKATILSITPDQAARPNTTITVILSETPVYQNYTWYYVSGTIYNSSLVSAPPVPSAEGIFKFVVYIEDSGFNNDSIEIEDFIVDATPLNYLLTNPTNNTALFESIEIIPQFDEIPAYLYHYWNQEEVNHSTNPIIAPNESRINNLTIFAGDLAKNFVRVDLTYIRHITQKLSTTQNHEIVDTGFIVNVSYSEQPKEVYIHWNNDLETNGSLTTTPTVSTKHFLNITTVSDFDIVTTYEYDFTIRILAGLTDQSEYERLQSGTEIFLNFTQTPSSWQYKWDARPIWKFDTRPLLPGSEGYHVLHVRILNNFEDSFDQSFTIFVDNTAPSVSVAPLTNFVQRSNQNVSVEITDRPSCPNAGCIQLLKYFWNNASTNTSVFVDQSLPLPTIITLPDPIPAGLTANLTIFIEDSSGNQATYLYKYSLDDQAPLISSTTYPNGSILYPHNISDIVVSFDENVDIGNYTLFVNDIKKYDQVFSGTQILIEDYIIGYGNGSVRIGFNVTDRLQNSNNFVLTYTLQDKALNITLLSPLSLGAEKNVNFLVNKPLVFQQGIWKDSSGDILSSTGLNTTTPIYSGEVRFEYSVKDKQEQWYNKSIMFFVDNTPPSFLIQNITLINGSIIDYSDAGLDLALYNVSPSSHIQIQLFDLPSPKMFSGIITIKVTNLLGNTTENTTIISLTDKYTFSLNPSIVSTKIIIDFDLTDKFGNRYLNATYLFYNNTFSNNTGLGNNTFDGATVILALIGGAGVVGVVAIGQWIRKRK
ncbi:MAG: hypothetical protein HeimC3_41300 [Candidatus Heimdallarchaeota archaeon LC_3]|nr:MAG: hypothetical protein HeimC3_41300 [Candidatus Heimdallarchaeota archaeon LC_3]